jgi:hypothetical protein
MENKEKLIKSFDLIVRSWQDYSKNFKKFVMVYLYSLLGFVPLLALIAVVAILGRFNVWEFLPVFAQISLGFLFFLCFVVFLLLAVYYGTRAKIATFLLVKNNYSPALENFKESQKYFWGFLGLSLLYLVVVCAWGFVFLIPALIFGIYYSFATYILVAEEKRAFSSMERSYDLVRGYWWPVFGRMLLLMLAAFIVFLVISLPLNFMNEGSWIFVAYNVLVNLIWLVVSPYFIVYYCGLYKNLKTVNK